MTIDTEEDNWEPVRENITTKNIEQLPKLQKLFDQYHVKPTYLTTYEVVKQNQSAAIIKEFAGSKKCEIGAHLHPWNTPPLKESFTPQNTMLNNLDKKLQLEKLDTLTSLITKVAGRKPIAFRAGRYGINQSMLDNLIQQGYKVDSSYTPFFNWKKYYGIDFSNYSNLEMQKLFHTSTDKFIIEMPITIAFKQKKYATAKYLFSKFKNTKIIGLLERLGLLNIIYLSNEQYSFKQLSSLTDSVIHNYIPILVFSFHSNNLVPGLTPFVQNSDDLIRFYDTLKNIIEYFLKKEMQPITLSEVISINL